MARKRLSQKKLKLIRFFVVLIFLISLIIGIDVRIRPVIYEVARNEALRLSNQLVDDAVTEYMADKNVDYNYLVMLSRDADGKVTSIETNSLHIDALKAAMSRNISEKIGKIRNEKFSIPIGTFFGEEILVARGPRIPFYISLTGNVHTKIKSQFYAAGINQTLHDITMEVTMQVYIVCPGYNTAVKYQTNISLAQTVIVGDVPDTYNNIRADMHDYTANYPTYD